MADSQKRIKILSDIQVQEIYAVPKFDEDERFIVFSLEDFEKKQIENLRMSSAKARFILMLGYFKSKQMFFPLDTKIMMPDIHHINARYFSSEVLDFSNITNKTLIKYQNIIMEMFEFRYCKKSDRKKLELKAQKSASISIKPLYVFDELVIYCKTNRFVLPSYTALQDAVGKAIVTEKRRVENLLHKKLPLTLKDDLRSLLNKGDSLCHISKIKKDAKDFNNKEMLKEIGKIDALKSVYDRAINLIPLLGISTESVKYYASLLIYYSHSRLASMNEKTTNLFLLCFAFYKYETLYDNLIRSLQYHIRKIDEESANKSRDVIADLKIVRNDNLDGVGEILKMFYDSQIAKNVKKSLQDGNIPRSDLYFCLQNIAHKFVAKDQLKFVAENISDFKVDREGIEWQYKEENAARYKKNLRPIIKAIEFGSNNKRDPLLSALKSLKKSFEAKKTVKDSTKYFHLQLIPKKKRKYFYTVEEKNKQGRKKKLINANRYEIYIYELLVKSVEEDAVFCKSSSSFKSLEDDLIEKSYWTRNKLKILQKLDAPRMLMNIEDILKGFKNDLESLIIEVNKRILSGENKYIRVKGRGDKRTWSLIYKNTKPPDYQSIFGQLKKIGVDQLLRSVDETCNFSHEFQPIKGKNIADVKLDILIATILAMATNTGLSKMAEVSDISYNELSTLFNQCFRLETIKNASDRITNEIRKLGIFRDYDIEDGLIYSSSDGQKYETKIPTINARHSSKYFGTKRGFSSISGVANHVPFNMTLISPNDHESHYVYDILSNNSSDIVPDIHTTDTHGSNRANFILLNMFGFKFAPRLKDIKSRTKNLIGFKNQKFYMDKDLLISPNRKAQEKAIIDEWDNILRIFASLGMKTTTQSTIVRKICSQKGYSKTKKALWELNDIVKSIHIYEFINDPQMRQNIQKALNRGESYNKLVRAIADVGGGKFRFRTEIEHRLGIECNRLVSNAIIYHNLRLLSYFKEHKKSLGIKDIVEIIKKTSPVAWRHYNLQGRYNFRGSKSVKFDEIFKALKDVKITKKPPVSD
ncbi:MAG: Tn3 family transposase [Desulfobacterales bacterium]|nr:Tn3 family transposase [Desulfobacterales bacterium]